LDAPFMGALSYSGQRCPKSTVAWPAESLSNADTQDVALRCDARGAPANRGL